MNKPSSQPDARRPQRLLTRTLRGILAITLLAFVLAQVHWHDTAIADEAGHTITSPGVLSSLAGVDPVLLAMAFALSIISILVSALRWRLLLRAQEVIVSAREAFKLQLIGEFFNTVVPGMVGGDLVKAYYVMKGRTRKAHILVSVFVDRLTGVCGMVFTALVMLVILCGTGQPDSSLVKLSAPSVAAVSVASTMALAFLFSSRLRQVLGLQKLYARLPIAHHLEHARDAMHSYRSRPGKLVGAFVVSLVAQALNSGFVCLLGVAIGLELSWAHYFLHVPLIMIISAVPITPGGIGVAEQLYLLYFASAGNPSQVLALAVLVRANTIAAALPGGIFAFCGQYSTKKS